MGTGICLQLPSYAFVNIVIVVVIIISIIIVLIVVIVVIVIIVVIVVIVVIVIIVVIVVILVVIGWSGGPRHLSCVPFDFALAFAFKRLFLVCWLRKPLQQQPTNQQTRNCQE